MIFFKLNMDLLGSGFRPKLLECRANFGWWRDT
jgi:hypothetical protein